MKRNCSKEFYSNFLFNNYEQSIEKYYCIIQTLDIKPVNETISEINQVFKKKPI
jgi:hypothetical protein